MEQLLLTFAIVCVFYLVIPGTGAFLVRARWRSFRRHILQTSLYRVAGYEQFRAASSTTDGELLGAYRFFGMLEAIQGDDTIWLRSGNVTVAVEMRDVRVHTLSPLSNDTIENEKNGEHYPDSAPQILSWSRVGSLPEGTRFYVGGRLEVQRGIPTFKTSSLTPLLVVIYEGAEEGVLPRSIWSGRQRNEYWNQFTPASLLTGAFSLLVVSYFFLRSPLLRLAVLFSLTMSSIPILPLLPPGLVLFFMYRFWWRKGRYFRAQRDLVRLPLRFFMEKAEWARVQAEPLAQLAANLPDHSLYCGRPVEHHLAEAAIENGALLRDVAEFSPPETDSQFYLFGARHSEESESMLVKPRDPMAEFVVYRHDPAQLAERCDHEAKRLERFSAVAFFLCILVNGYGVFLALSNLVR